MIGPLTGKGNDKSLLSIDMKTKVVQHVPRMNISISHMTYSFLSLHIKTKVVQHVPRMTHVMHAHQILGPVLLRRPYVREEPKNVMLLPNVPTSIPQRFESG